MIRTLRAAAAAGLLGLAAACSTAPSSGPTRSLLLVTIDTLRPDHVTDTIAPALTALARESIAFQNAVSVSPLTNPAHASLLTGLAPFEHGVRDNELFALGDQIPTITEAIKRAGHATGAFVSAPVLDARFGLARGFDVYDDEISGPERGADETLARARRWLASAPRPVFLWIHLFEPHAPYRGGSYAADVTAADGALGAFLSELRRERLWNELVVGVTADHGESLGEHGEATHGFFVYDATIRIPWILRAPGRQPGTYPHQVRILDVLPTMMAMAGLEAPADPRRQELMRGVNLVPFLDRGETASLDAYSETYLPRHQFGWSELKALRTGRYKLIDAPRPELYELAGGEAPSRNLFEQRREDAAALARRLSALAAQPAAGQPVRFDPARTETLASLGYLSGAFSSPDAGRRADPKDKVAVYSLIMEALELAGTGRGPEAIDRLERARRLDPGVAQVHFLSGTILGDMGRLEAAIPALERAVALTPRYAAAHFKLALAHLRLGRHEEAERALNAVLEQDPNNVSALHNLAVVAYNRRDLARAEALEKRALAIDANYFEAWNALGAILLLTKRTDRAIEALQKAVQLNPQSGQAFANLALALEASGRREDARAALKQACSLDPRYCQGP